MKTKKYRSYQDCWKTLFKSLEQFSDDFMEGDRQQPEVQARESIFEEKNSERNNYK